VTPDEQRDGDAQFVGVDILDDRAPLPDS